jgi:hypothetical protein
VTTRADAPVIASTALAAGHDGRAELVLELAYPNGARTHLSVTEEAMARALDAAGVDRLEDLEGQPWTVLFGPDQLGEL